MKVGDKVRTTAKVQGIPTGTIGYIDEKRYLGYIDEKKYHGCEEIVSYKFISENENDYQGWFFENELCLMEDDMEKEKSKMIPKEVYEGLLQMKTICIMHTTNDGKCMINCPFADISKKLNDESDFCMIKDNKPSDMRFEVKTNYYISKGD